MGVSVDLTVKTVKNVSGSSTSRTNNNGENREEGEIVDDDFEDIISSDEELSMRKRIEELEARNSELEKLANISGFYYDVGCASDRFKPGTHTNVIDISDTEDCSYAPSVLYSKKKPRKQVTQVPSTRPIQHIKPHAPSAYKQGKKRSDPLEAVDSPLRESHRTKKRKYEKHVRPRGRGSRKKEHTKSRKKPSDDYTHSSDDELCSLDRNELRRALRYDPVLANVPSRTNDDVKRSSCHTIEEPKIECETIEINDNSDKQADSDDSESLELKELRLIALKSVFLERGRKRKQRKQLEARKPYSPTDCLVPIIPVDSDITSPDDFSDHGPSRNMDISPIASPETIGDESLSKPVDMDIVESSNSMSPEFLPSQSWVPIHPVNMTGYFPNILNSEAGCRFGTQMHSNRIISPTVIRAQPQCASHIPIETDEDEEVEIKNEEVASPEPLDEEVLALRTLLLAQKNSPKYSKNIIAVPEPPPVPEVKHVEQQIERDPMVAILGIAQGPPSKTAEILKEAVKRLQNKSTKEEITENLTYVHSMKSTVEKEHLSAKPIIIEQSDNFENQHSGHCPIVLPVAHLPLAPPRPIEVVGNVQIPNLATTAAAVKHVKVKENMYATQGTRPNIIEIVPTNILPRIVRKSPLADITETDNVTVKKPDIKSKPKTEKSTIGRCIGTAANSADSASIGDKIKSIVSEVPDSSSEEQVEIQKLKNLTQSELTTTEAAASLSTPKIQRKKSTTLEALQLKTQNLVSNGRYIISRNKLVANKLLNKAIHNSSAPVKRKIVSDRPNLLTEDTRLIKTVAVPTVKRLIITVGSKSESDSESDASLGAPNQVSDTSMKPSPAVGELYDVASPMSLPMESPRDSPLTVAVSIETNDVLTTTSAVVNITDCANAIDPVPGQSIDVKNNHPVWKDDLSKTSTKPSGETLEAKVEKFLKNVRSQVDSLKKESTVNQSAKRIETNKAKNTSTPAAVKHLPLSSQLEYRRLVNRMQALEKQKQTRCKPAVTSNNTTLKVTISNGIKDPILKLQPTEPCMPIAPTVDRVTPIDVKPAENATNAVNSIAQTNQNSHKDKPQAIKCENETINHETALSVNKEPAENLKNEIIEPPNESPKKPLSKAIEIQSEPKMLESPKKVLKPVPSTKVLKTVPKTTKSVPVSKPSVAVKKNPATNTAKTIPVPKPTVTPMKPNTTKVSKPAPKTPKPLNSANKNLPATKKIITKSRSTKTTQVTSKSPAASATKPTKVLKKIVPATKNKLLPLSVEECQTQYIQSSTNLVDNITKTIQLVIDVQNEKRERSLLQHELSELRKRMLEVESKIKAKDLAMSAVIPKISSSHKIIVALKERTSHLEELSVDLCKRTGDERNNSLYMEQKNKVKKLSKTLSVEIKNWKSMETPNEVGAKTGQNVNLETTSGTEICGKNIKVNSNNAAKGRKIGINTSTQNSDTARCNNPSDHVGTGSVSGSVDNRNSNSASVSTNSSGVKLSITRNVKSNVTTAESKQTSNKCDKRNVQSSVDTVKIEGETAKTGNGSETDETGQSASKRRKTSCESRQETLYYKIRNESGSEDPEATKLEMKEKKILPHSEYVSPLDHSNEFDRCIDPAGIVCPYQLTGLCQDKDCKFIHLETQNH